MWLCLQNTVGRRRTRCHSCILRTCHCGGLAVSFGAPVAQVHSQRHHEHLLLVPRATCWFHMPPVACQVLRGPLGAGSVYNSFIRMCSSAGQLQLSCSLWVSWQTGLLLRAGNWMALRRINEPQKMWHSKKRTVLVPWTLCPWSVPREIQCNGLKNILLALISFKW